MICLISLSKISDVLPTFTFARALGDLLSICLRVNVFYPFPYVSFIGKQELILDLHKEHLHFTKCFFFYLYLQLFLV